MAQPPPPKASPPAGAPLDDVEVDGHRRGHVLVRGVGRVAAAHYGLQVVDQVAGGGRGRVWGGREEGWERGGWERGSWGEGG